MQCREKEIHIKKIPRWFAKFILRSQYNPNNQQIFFTLLEPMTPQEWCLIWMPIIHPGVELPQDGDCSDFLISVIVWFWNSQRINFCTSKNTDLLFYTS
jgi:hypothetical protein